MIAIDHFFGHPRSLQIKFKPKSKPKKAIYAAKTLKKWIFFLKNKIFKKYLKLNFHFSFKISNF